MPDEEFSLEQLHQLVDQALHDAPGDVAHASPGHRLVFGLGAQQLFARFYEVLSGRLPGDEVQTVLAELRAQAFRGIDRGNLRELHTVVMHCRRCPQMEPDPQLPHGNLANPDVVFVLEFPFRETLADQRFETLVTDVGFDRRKIAFTSVIRCDPLTVRAPDPTELHRCAESYLFTELQILSPRLIVTIGAVPSSILLGNAAPLGEIRGALFWLGTWAVLPTWSPGYTMRREDAKAALHADLHRAYDFCYSP